MIPDLAVYNIFGFACRLKSTISARSLYSPFEDVMLNSKEYNKEYRAKVKYTIKYITGWMYGNQNIRSKKLNWIMPKYDLKEFRSWLIDKTKFDVLFNIYEKSGFEKDLKPVVDRINPKKHYLFSNMQVITHKQNHLKSYLIDVQIHRKAKNKSGFVGVCWDKECNRWLATFGRKKIGRFKSFQDAVNARKKVHNEKLKLLEVPFK